MGKPNYVNLTSFSDVRRFLSKLINERRNNEIPSAKYKDLIYGVSKLQNVLEAIYLQTEIEERLAKLEGTNKRPSFGTYPQSVDSESKEYPEGH